MKASTFITLLFLILTCHLTAQDNNKSSNLNVTLKASDCVIGLDQLDMFRMKLYESGLLINESNTVNGLDSSPYSGVNFEIWDNNSIEVRIEDYHNPKINSVDCRIIITIHASYKGVPERLFEGIKEIFPDVEVKKTDYDEKIGDMLLIEETRYIHKFSRGDNISASVRARIHYITFSFTKLAMQDTSDVEHAVIPLY